MDTTKENKNREGLCSLGVGAEAIFLSLCVSASNGTSEAGHIWWVCEWRLQMKRRLEKERNREEWSQDAAWEGGKEGKWMAGDISHHC